MDTETLASLVEAADQELQRVFRLGKAIFEKPDEAVPARDALYRLEAYLKDRLPRIETGKEIIEAVYCFANDLRRVSPFAREVQLAMCNVADAPPDCDTWRYCWTKLKKEIWILSKFAPRYTFADLLDMFEQAILEGEDGVRVFLHEDGTLDRNCCGGSKVLSDSWVPRVPSDFHGTYTARAVAYNRLARHLISCGETFAIDTWNEWLAAGCKESWKVYSTRKRKAIEDAIDLERRKAEATAYWEAMQAEEITLKKVKRRGRKKTPQEPER